MQLQIVPRREFQCELRLIMRLASRTFRDFHTRELERRIYARHENVNQALC